jgi:TP901 family phage tail tape measure protein
MSNLDIVIRARNDAKAALSELDRSLGGLQKQSHGLSGALGNLGSVLKVGLVAGAGAAAAAISSVGAAALAVAAQYDDAQDTLIAATGASGQALEEMSASVRDLKASVAGLDRTYGEIAAVMGEVNTRTGASGQALDDFSAQVLKMTRITGDDGVKAVQLITRTMGDWGVPLEESSLLMDKLFGAGQSFGIGLDSLAGKLVQFGAPLRQMGFGLDESIAMLGKWEKEGVNTELVIGSLRIAAGQFARAQSELSSELAAGEFRALAGSAANKSLAESLRETFHAIQNANSETEALNIGMETFGARAGPDMVAAIREGRFELDEAIAAMEGMAGSIDDVTARQLGLEERWQIGMARVTDSLIPVGNELREIGLSAMPFVEEAAGRLAAFLGETLPGAIGEVREAWADDWGGIRTTIESLPGDIAPDITRIKIHLLLMKEDVRAILREMGIDTGADWETFWGDLATLTIEGIADNLATLEEYMPGLRSYLSGFLALLRGDWETFWREFAKLPPLPPLSFGGERFDQWLEENVFKYLRILRPGSLFGAGEQSYGPTNTPTYAPGFAAGTTFAPGGLALVGERGPELVHLPRGSQVLPAERTRQALGHSQSVTINNYMTVSSEQDIASLTERILGQLRRQQGQQAWLPTF